MAICKYCTRKPLFNPDGYFDPYENQEMLANGGWSELRIGVDEEGRLIIVGLGEASTDFYYPSFCPECGRRLKDWNENK